MGHCEPLRRLLVRPVPVGPSFLLAWPHGAVRWSPTASAPLRSSSAGRVPPSLGALLLRWARFSFGGRVPPPLVVLLLRWARPSSAGRAPPLLVALLLCWSCSSFAGCTPPLLVALLLRWSRSSSAGRVPPTLVTLLRELRHLLRPRAPRRRALLVRPAAPPPPSPSSPLSVAFLATSLLRLVSFASSSWPRPGGRL